MCCSINFRAASPPMGKLTQRSGALSRTSLGIPGCSRLMRMRLQLSRPLFTAVFVRLSEAFRIDGIAVPAPISTMTTYTKYASLDPSKG